MKLTKVIGEVLGVIIIIPFIIVITTLLIPFIIYFIITGQIEKIRDKKELKELLEINEGQIYFLFSDYNHYNFSKVIEKKYKDIICMKVDRRVGFDLLTEHLVKGCANRGYPRLVKIKNGNLIHKEHYNSFKNLYKRKNDIDAFFDLIEKSIINLRKGKS